MVEYNMYSWKIGLWKVVKNGLIFLLPSLLAYQANVPEAYAWLISGLIYFIKNYVENK